MDCNVFNQIAERIPEGYYPLLPGSCLQGSKMMQFTTHKLSCYYFLPVIPGMREYF